MDMVSICFIVSMLMTITGIFSANNDFVGVIFGLMFWCIGWVIQWGQVRNGS